METIASIYKEFNQRVETEYKGDPDRVSVCKMLMAEEISRLRHESRELCQLVRTAFEEGITACSTTPEERPGWEFWVKHSAEVPDQLMEKILDPTL